MYCVSYSVVSAARMWSFTAVWLGSGTAEDGTLRLCLVSSFYSLPEALKSRGLTFRTNFCMECM
jgi:hypothetical protein